MSKLKIEIKELNSKNLKQPPQVGEKLDFGKNFTNRMFKMKWTPSAGWHAAEICAYGNFSLSPAALVLHYGQEIFEGVKAYRWADDSIVLFRPQDNIARMNVSAKRMCLPQLPEEDVLSALIELIKLEKDWIPKSEGAALYIRPTMIGIDPYIGLKSAEEVLFYIILTPVEAYYTKPIAIMVEDKYVRAVRGGTGMAKTGGNYAASIYPITLAKEKGYDDILWLDGVEQKYVEEVGSMNIFFVYKDKLVTSILNNSILPGITRDSVLKLARYWGLETVEKKLDIHQIVEDLKAGQITEIFGSGTAVIISPVGLLATTEEEFVIGEGKDKIGALTQKFYNNLTGIQYGKTKDAFGWIVKAI
ncbi:MAG: branched-chain amino acid aminotransferase [Deltaproteobacteria bacterium]|jgi:branched-chain amino acid aminotransferase|nr:branched-chain amino acid aminotransferase [Deltaproteobacteria bacterium]